MILLKQTSSIIYLQVFAPICIKTKIKLFYLLFCLYSSGQSGTECAHCKRRLIAKSTATLQVSPLFINQIFLHAPFPIETSKTCCMLVFGNTSQSQLEVRPGWLEYSCLPWPSSVTQKPCNSLKAKTEFQPL